MSDGTPHVVQRPLNTCMIRVEKENCRHIAGRVHIDRASCTITP